jgi:hypothetical protein
LAYRRGSKPKPISGRSEAQNIGDRDEGFELANRDARKRHRTTIIKES